MAWSAGASNSWRCPDTLGQELRDWAEMRTDIRRRLVAWTLGLAIALAAVPVGHPAGWSNANERYRRACRRRHSGPFESGPPKSWQRWPPISGIEERGWPSMRA